jgi:hypothetical protein
MKTKLFLSFLIFMMGIGSLYAKTENNPRDGLKEAFEWHLTPGTYEQKEYAMQNPGEWVRIDDQRKDIEQRDQYGILEQGTVTLLRLICYDKEKRSFLYEERVASFEVDKKRTGIRVWMLPIFSLFLSSLVISFGFCLFGEEDLRIHIIIVTIFAIIVVIDAWYVNRLLMWFDIILFALFLFALVKTHVKSIKKKKEIKN